jgi:MGT family glycosyltransferase
MTTSSRRFLMTTWDGGGNVPPEMGVARRLIERGHQVHVLADPTVGEPARAAGCSFSPWELAPHRKTLDPSQDLLKDWESGNPLVMLQRLRDRFIAGPAAAFAADTAAAIGEVRPHCVVPDAFLFGSIIAAQEASVPVVPLVSNIWVLPSRGAPSIGPGFPMAKTVLGRTRDAALLAIVNRLFRRGLPALNAARAEHGLQPLTSFYDQALGADRILVLTSETFDYASSTIPGNVRYVGPVLDDPQWTEPWHSPWPARRDEPLILVGLSSTYQRQEGLLQRIIDALSGLPVRAVATLGRMLQPDAAVSSPNVQVVPSAPHTAILREASVAVTHCGHGTTMRALAAGVPMVCIPMGRDQNDTAARVVHHGAGVRLSPSASTAKIRSAVLQVLADDEFRSNAARLATVLAHEHHPADVAIELERVAGDVALDAT